MIEPKPLSVCAESFAASALEAAHTFGEVVLHVDASQQNVEVSMINTTDMHTNSRTARLVRDAYLIDHASDNSDQRFFYQAMLECSALFADIRSELLAKLNSKWRIQYDPLSFAVFLGLTSGKKRAHTPHLL